MIIAFQLALFALIITSIILLVSVPVAFASPVGWRTKWIGLVFLVGGYP